MVTPAATGTPTEEQIVLAAETEGTAAPIATPVLETPVPQIPAPTTPPAPTADQIELVNARRQLAEVHASRQATITEDALQQEGQRVYDEEIAQGQSPEDALRIAKRHYAISRQAVAQQQEAQVRQRYAESVGQKHGVAPGLLMGATSVPHMEEIAQRILLQRRVEVLERKQVPAQTFNNSAGSPAGGIQATADNIDKLWFDFETQHPGQNNPHDAAYRKAMTR